MKAIGTLGTIPTITVGGRVFTDLENLISLTGYAAASPNVIGVMTKQNGPVPFENYQVPSGKSFNCLAMSGNGYGTSASRGFQLGYNDDELDPSQTYQSGDSEVATAVFLNFAMYTTGAPGDTVERPCNILLPEDKYAICGAEVGYLTVYGYEI